MKERLIEILNSRPGPDWCLLMEVACGEISNYMNRLDDYELAKKFQPDIFTFTQDDLLNCSNVNDIPEDWLKYLYACIEKYNI